jgi:hypothetical protein
MAGGLGPVRGVADGVTEGRVFAVGLGVGLGIGVSSLGLGVGDGLKLGRGVGVVDFRFALRLKFASVLKFVSKLAFVLKLKFESNPRLVFRFAFRSGGLVLILVLTTGSL